MKSPHTRSPATQGQEYLRVIGKYAPDTRVIMLYSDTLVTSATILKLDSSGCPGLQGQSIRDRAWRRKGTRVQNTSHLLSPADRCYCVGNIRRRSSILLTLCPDLTAMDPLPAIVQQIQSQQRTICGAYLHLVPTIGSVTTPDLDLVVRTACSCSESCRFPESKWVHEVHPLPPRPSASQTAHGEKRLASTVRLLHKRCPIQR
jgi:hypothetical protein